MRPSLLALVLLCLTTAVPATAQSWFQPGASESFELLFGLNVSGR